MRYLLLGTFLLVPAVNYLSFLFARDDSRFDDGLEVRIDAAGYAFSIWGVIFIGMIAFSFFQLRHGRQTNHLKQAYIYLIIAGLASIAFVPISFSENQLLAAGNLWWHLIALVFANRALRAHAGEVGTVNYAWTYFAPSMYLGWISAATVIATSLMLAQLGIDLSEGIQVLIAFAFVVVLYEIARFLNRRGDPVYALTVAWALVAIAVEQNDRDGRLLLLGGVAGAALLVLAVVNRYRDDASGFFYAAGRS